MERNTDVEQRKISVRLPSSTLKARSVSRSERLVAGGTAVACGAGTASARPRKIRRITDITMPGITLTITTCRQVRTVSSAPATNGATASPTLPPMPWMETTSPLRSG